MMYLFTFASTHHAMAAERMCEQAFACRLIPLPPVISAGCGLALRVEEKNVTAAKQMLTQAQIPFDLFHKIADNQYEAVQ